MTRSFNGQETIVPLILGAGDEEILIRYSRGFACGFFPVKGNAEDVQACCKAIVRFMSGPCMKRLSPSRPFQEFLAYLRMQAKETTESVSK